MPIWKVLKFRLSQDTTKANKEVQVYRKKDIIRFEWIYLAMTNGTAVHVDICPCKVVIIIRFNTEKRIIEREAKSHQVGKV